MGPLPYISVVTCIRVAIVDAHELTSVGLAHVLVTAPGSPFFVVPADHDETPPDVVLYGVDDEGEMHHDPDLHTLLRGSLSTVIVTCWDESSPAVEAALACGAHGALSMKLPAAELLEQIEKIHRGRPDGRLLPPEGACHPEIARTGLTPREVDVLGLIAAGLTNQEIADRLYLSINSVKTYIRTAYRKIGAERRAHAVVWVERHALTPPPTGPAPDRDDVAAE